MRSGKILVAVHQQTWVLKMVGDVRMTLCNTIDYCMQQLFDNSLFDEVIVDLTETEGIDSTSLGLLAKLSIKSQKRTHKVPALVLGNENIARTLQSIGFDESVFKIVGQINNLTDTLIEIPEKIPTEEIARTQVLEAHHILMDLNESNRGKFKDLVLELEKLPINQTN